MEAHSRRQGKRRGVTEIYIKKHGFALKNAGFISLVGNISLCHFLPQNYRQADTSRCSRFSFSLLFCFFSFEVIHFLIFFFFFHFKCVETKTQFQRALTGNIFTHMKLLFYIPRILVEIQRGVVLHF